MSRSLLNGLSTTLIARLSSLTFVLGLPATSALLSTGAAAAKEVELKLAWSDEFNYTGQPDSSKWNYDVGVHGWGNQELQFYTDKRSANARVQNGSLITSRSWSSLDLSDCRSEEYLV